MATNISFDGNNLQTTAILTDTIGHEQLPNKIATMFQLSHANRSTIPFVSYSSKSIKVSGKVIGTSIADLDSKLDTFRGYFLGTDKNLDIDYNGTTRRYIATVNGIMIDRPGGLAYANFSIDFVCTQPFGQNIATTNALALQTGRTLNAYTDSHTFLGNAPFQLPLATFNYGLAASSASNLIANPGFETDLSGWALTGAGGTNTRVTTQFHGGVAAMQIVNAASATAGNYGGTFYALSGLTAGQSYTLSLWAKGNAGGEIISLQPVTGTVKNLTLTTAWQQVAVTFTATGTSAAINIYSTNAASSTWFLDDVSVVANTAATVNWGNASNGQALYITRIWAIDDVLIIDCVNKTVTVNGVAVPFTGAFPEFAPGSQNMSYNDTLLSRSFSEVVTYYPMWL